MAAEIFNLHDPDGTNSYSPQADMRIGHRRYILENGLVLLVWWN